MLHDKALSQAETLNAKQKVGKGFRGVNGANR